MAQCTAGTQVAPGAPDSFWVFDNPFLQYLTSKIPALATVIAGISPPELVITSAFCSSEPVVPTAPTLADYALALLVPGSLHKITDYWKAAFKASVWPTYCQ